MPGTVQPAAPAARCAVAHAANNPKNKEGSRR
jgi:hypothetical protein